MGRESGLSMVCFIFWMSWRAVAVYFAPLGPNTITLPSKVHTFPRPKISLASSRSLFLYLVRDSVIRNPVVFRAFLFLHTISRSAYEINLTINGRLRLPLRFHWPIRWDLTMRFIGILTPSLSSKNFTARLTGTSLSTSGSPCMRRQFRRLYCSRASSCLPYSSTCSRSFFSSVSARLRIASLRLSKTLAWMAFKSTSFPYELGIALRTSSLTASRILGDMLYSTIAAMDTAWLTSTLLPLGILTAGGRKWRLEGVK